VSPVCVRVRVGREHYAFGVHEVLEVADLGEVIPVAGAGAAVMGVSKVHGQILPVIDLGAILGASGERDVKRLVVAEQRGRRAGLAVDQLEDVGELPAPSERPESAYLEGAALVGGVLIGMIDVAAVFESASAARGAS
jgi:purine-binding chemotaxis protein CheW